MSDLDKVLDYLARDGYGTPIGVLESVPAARLELAALRAENEAMRKALALMVVSCDALGDEDRACAADQKRLDDGIKLARAALAAKERT